MKTTMTESTDQGTRVLGAVRERGAGVIVAGAERSVGAHSPLRGESRRTPERHGRPSYLYSAIDRMEEETRRLEGMTPRSPWLHGLFWILLLTAVGAAAYIYILRA